MKRLTIRNSIMDTWFLTADFPLVDFYLLMDFRFELLLRWEQLVVSWQLQMLASNAAPQS